MSQISTFTNIHYNMLILRTITLLSSLQMKKLIKQLGWVEFTDDFFILFMVFNEKISFSEGFQLMRQKQFKIILEDYIKKGSQYQERRDGLQLLRLCRDYVFNMINLWLIFEITIQILTFLFLLNVAIILQHMQFCHIQINIFTQQNVSTQLYLFIIIFIHFYSIMIYTKYTPQYQLAARQLINKSFAKNSPIPGIVQVTDQQVYKYRSQYIKFDNIVGLMVLEPITKKLIGVGFTEDFFDFVQGVNQKITYSQGFEFMRQKIFKVIVDDYLKKYPTLKRGIIGYNYSASVDIQYKNQKILANLTLETCHFNKKLGYNKTLFLSVDERVLNAFMNFGPLVALKPKITYYPPKNQILRGKLLNIGAWCIQVDLYTQFYPKL